MAVNMKVLDHNGSDGSAFYQWIVVTGATYRTAGENMGGGPGTGSQTPTYWIDYLDNQMMTNDAASNWGHRANILNPAYGHVGIGVIVDSHGQTWLTEDFTN
jgi:uncharacterized protein YkwD